MCDTSTSICDGIISDIDCIRGVSDDWRDLDPLLLLVPDGHK